MIDGLKSLAEVKIYSPLHHFLSDSDILSAPPPVTPVEEPISGSKRYPYRESFILKSIFLLRLNSADLIK
jgi:hypothetical protein